MSQTSNVSDFKCPRLQMSQTSNVPDFKCLRLQNSKFKCLRLQLSQPSNISESEVQTSIVLELRTASVLHSKFVSTLKDTLGYLEMMVKPPYHPPQILYLDTRVVSLEKTQHYQITIEQRGPWIPPPTSLLSSAYRYCCTVDFATPYNVQFVSIRAKGV